MRHLMSCLTPGVIALVFAITTAVAAQSTLAENKEKDWQGKRLQPIPLEELSDQNLMEIYVACLRSLDFKEKNNGKTVLTVGDINSACEDERKNLRVRISQQNINGLDELFITTASHGNNNH